MDHIIGAHLHGVSRGIMAARLRDPAEEAVGLRISTRFDLQYFEGGALKWRAKTKNRVVTAGLNRVLNAALVTGNVTTATANETYGTGNGATTTFAHTLAGVAGSSGTGAYIKPGTVVVTAGAVVATDNGAGAFSGAGIASGTINYSTGACSIVYSAAPANALAITANYTAHASPALFMGLCGASVTDGAITSGSPNLVNATSTPYTSGDVGRAITVRGAGAAAADLVTTILAFTDSGHVTLNANAGTTVSAAAVIFDARAADTMAGHSPWIENAAYSQANRPGWSPGTVAAGSVDNSAQNSGVGSQFTINANNQLIGGVFLSDSNAISGTSGLLYGMAPFGAPGFQQMNSGGTLNVIATATAASS